MPGSRLNGLNCIAAGLAMLALAGCSAPTEDPAKNTATMAAGPGPVTASTATSTKRPAGYAQCAACHAVQPGKNGVGPSLAGVWGRKAGSVPGFAYSSAMTASGLVWDEVNLDRYLAAPAQTVRGTKMSYSGLSDGEERKELIEYLKTLK